MGYRAPCRCSCRLFEASSHLTKENPTYHVYLRRSGSSRHLESYTDAHSLEIWHTPEVEGYTPQRECKGRTVPMSVARSQEIQYQEHHQLARLRETPMITLVLCAVNRMAITTTEEMKEPRPRQCAYGSSSISLLAMSHRQSAVDDRRGPLPPIQFLWPFGSSVGVWWR